MEASDGRRDSRRLEQIVAQVRLGCADHAIETAERARTGNIVITDPKGRHSIEILERTIATLGVSGPPSRRMHFKNLQEVLDTVGAPSFKAMTVAMGMLREAWIYPSTRLLGAKCCAMAIMSRILARSMNLTQEKIWDAEIGGMFLPMGRIAFALYSHQTGESIEDWFVARYHHALNSLLMQRYELPDHFKTMVGDGNPLRFTIESLSVSSVVRTAAAIVSRSFAEHAKFVIEARMPDERRILYPSTVGSEIEDYFQELGFAEYLRITPIPHPENERVMIAHAYKMLRHGDTAT